MNEFEGLSEEDKIHNAIEYVLRGIEIPSSLSSGIDTEVLKQIKEAGEVIKHDFD